MAERREVMPAFGKNAGCPVGVPSVPVLCQSIFRLMFVNLINRVNSPVRQEVFILSKNISDYVE